MFTLRIAIQLIPTFLSLHHLRHHHQSLLKISDQDILVIPGAIVMSSTLGSFIVLEILFASHIPFTKFD